MIQKSALIALLFAGVLSSCTTYTAAVDPTPSPKAQSAPAQDASADAKTAEAKAAEAKKEEAAQRKKTRDVDYARLQLELAKFDAENETKAAKRAVESAERELSAAKSERDLSLIHI